MTSRPQSSGPGLDKRQKADERAWLETNGSSSYVVKSAAEPQHNQETPRPITYLIQAQPSYEPSPSRISIPPIVRTRSTWKTLPPILNLFQGIYYDLLNLWTICYTCFPMRLFRFLLSILFFLSALFFAISFIGYSVKEDSCNALLEVWIGRLPAPCDKLSPGLRWLKL